MSEEQSESQSDSPRSHLWLCLEKLCDNEGIYQPNLVELLASDLRELQQRWNISLDRGSDVARETVKANLRMHIRQLAPRPEWQGKSSELRTKQFRECLSACFNITGKFGDALAARRAFLDSPARRELRISRPTIGRYLTEGITQIEQQLLAENYRPETESQSENTLEEGINPALDQTERHTLVPGSVSVNDGGTSPEAFAEPSADITEVLQSKEDSPVTTSFRPRRLMIASTIALIAAAAIATILVMTSNSPSPPRSTWTGPPPVLIESVTPLVDSAGSTFVLGQKLSMTKGELMMFNKQVFPDSDSFAKWSAVHKSTAVDSAFTTVTLRGNAKEQVTISRVSISKRCQAPLAGTMFYEPSQGDESVISMTFNLDSPNPIAQEVLVSSERGVHPAGDYFEHNDVITLKPGEQITLSLGAFTSTQYCKFTYRMLVGTSLGPVSEEISDGGRPFEISATAKSTDQNLPYSKYGAAYLFRYTPPIWEQIDPTTYRRAS